MSRANVNAAAAASPSLIHPPLKGTATAAATVLNSFNDGGLGEHESLVAARPAKTVEGSSSKSKPMPVPTPAHPELTSTTATLNLIQRILTPEKHIAPSASSDPSTIEQILPPLTSSNDVDIELYAILAIVIKEFVNTWYSKITSDHVFVEEIIQIVAHCSRALEQRLRQVDVTALLLDELPVLIEQHYRTYRSAQVTAAISPFNLDLRHLYHASSPHPALAPPPDVNLEQSLTLQAENERAYRHLLVQGALAVLLPTEDLQNEPLRILVGDIIADLILGQAVCAKVAEAWFLHDAICKVITAANNKSSNKVRSSTTIEASADNAANRLEKFGLLTSKSPHSTRHSLTANQSRLTAVLWSIMQYGYSLFLFLRHVLKELQASGSRPMRQARYAASTSPSTPYSSVKLGLSDLNPHPPLSQDPQSRPVLAFGILSAISTLLDLETYMPWMRSMLVFAQHVLLTWGNRYGRLDSRVDRILYNAINTRLLPASVVADVLRSLRTAVFPNNAMGPPAPPLPTPAEREILKRQTAKAVLSTVPATLIHHYFATSDHDTIVDAIQTSLLDPLDDVYLNKHLVFSLLELVLVRLVPELAIQPISELLRDRGVSVEDHSYRPDHTVNENQPISQSG